MRILHYIPTYAPAWQWGGPVRSVSDLCEGLVARGHDVTVFTTDAGLGLDDIPARGPEVMRNGVRVHYFPRIDGVGIKCPALEAAVAGRVGEFDLVHVTAIWQRTGPAACTAAWRRSVPYVISPRGALGSYSWKRGRLKKTLYYLLRERASLSRAAGFHYTSAMEADECTRFRFNKPSCVVRNGMDLVSWQRDEAAGRHWRSANGIGPGETVFLYAGRIHHKKGLDLLPGVLGLLTSQNWRMIFVGQDDDGTGGALRLAFRHAGLESKVIFLPAVTPVELVPVYSGANAFLLPSRHENFGNVAVEAAACGCRVIASDQTGVARELAELQAGLCLPRETTVWAGALNQCIGARTGSPATRERLCQAFSRENTAGQMEEFYQGLLN